MVLGNPNQPHRITLRNPGAAGAIISKVDSDSRLCEYIAPGLINQVLVSQGSGLPPTWASVATIPGDGIEGDALVWTGGTYSWEELIPPTGTEGYFLVKAATGTEWSNTLPAGAETDPVFVASAAHSISSGDITNWNTAYSWGNHAGLYPLIDGSVGFTGGGENQLLTQGSSNDIIWESNLTFDGTILKSPQYGAPDNVTLVPTGTGAIQGLGGNARGNYAVDLQLDRDLDTQVAAANYSSLIGGSNNSIDSSSSYAAIVGGRDCDIIQSGYTAIIGCFDSYSSGSATTVVYYNGIVGSNSTNLDFARFCGIVGGTHLYIMGSEGVPLNANGLIGGSYCGISTSGNYDGIIGGYYCVIDSSSYCFIGSGRLNEITSSNYSSISGGRNNAIISDYCLIGGGNNNSIETANNYSTICGGYSNTIITATTNKNYNFIGGGGANQIQGIADVIVGGGENTILLAAGIVYAVIGGGRYNTLESHYCFIGGGYSNSIGTSCDYSAIISGDNHSIVASTHSVICGGDSNDIDTAADSIICGGDTNSITGSQYSVIVGGDNNEIPTGCGTRNFIGGGNSQLLVAAATNNGDNIIIGGYNHSIQGRYCIIVGGSTNDITLAAGALYSTIVGGWSNSSGSSYTFIGGGYQNIIGENCSDSTIVGGDTNSITTSEHAFIGGGDTNSIVASNDSVICGGDTNTIPTGCGTHNFIGGGDSNTTVAASTYNGENVIVGGNSNSIQGQTCFIGGGESNDIALTAGAQYSAIISGYNNSNGGDYSVISGGNSHAINDGSYNTISGGNGCVTQASTGDGNTISGGNTNVIVAASTYNGENTISGGNNNVIQGYRCFIGGGYDNTIAIAAGVQYSSINCGKSNTVTSDYSSASGLEAVADHYGEVAQASGKFSASGDAQFSKFLLRNQTTDDTATELFLDGSSERLTITEGETWFVTVKLIGRQTNGDYTTHGIHWEGILTRDSAGNATITNSDTIEDFTNDFSWSVAISADTSNQSLKITVQGTTDENISWLAHVDIVKVKG